MARSCAPTAAQRRALDELLSPKKPVPSTQRKVTRAAGVVGYSVGVIAIPVPKGFAQMTQDERLDVWEQHAVEQQQALMESTSADREQFKEPA